MKTRFILAAILLCTAILLNAQNPLVIRDLRLWSGVKIEKTFAKDWTLSLEEELRLKTNMSEINNFFTEAGLRYRINKNFSLGTAFRYTSDKKQDNSYEDLSRLHFDLRYRGRLEFLSIYYRLRYQREVETGEMLKQQAPYEKQFRNRLGVRFTGFELIEPYASVESFQVFSPYLSPLSDYWRFQAGLRIEPERIGEFRLAWGFNREFSSPEPVMIYLFRINYTYKL